MLSWDLILFASGVLLMAGTIKGFVGLGLPAIAMTFFTFVIDPRTGIALLTIPTLTTNLWQMLRGKDLKGVIRRHWFFAVVLCIVVAMTVWFSQSTSDRVLTFCLGIMVLVFVVLSWRDLVPRIPQGWERVVEAVLAATGGVIGGLTSAWAPPMAMYLKALRVSPDEFVQASGFLIAAGGVPLLVTFVAVGHAGPGLLSTSALLVIPTLAGFTIGERLRRGLDPSRFHQVLLIVFLGLGLNLIYRSLFA